MITRELELKVGYTNAILNQPLHIYAYDRNIQLIIAVKDYDFKFGGDLNGNFIGENNIVKAKAFLKSPSGAVFDNQGPIDIIDDKIYITITNIMTDDKEEIGEWMIQIALFDADDSLINLHPFKFTVEKLLVESGDPYFDAGHDDAETPDNYVDKQNLITSERLNNIENKLEYTYSESIYNDVEIYEYETENKTTINAINEINDIYEELYYSFNKTVFPEQYETASTFATRIESYANDTVEYVSIINKQYNKINPGEFYLYKAEVYPETISRYDIRWKSSNTSVAKVNSTGKVVGVNDGKAIITAYYKNDPRYYDRFEVIIGSYIPLNNIWLTPDEIKMNIGQTKSIKGTLRPANTTERDIVVTLSNPEVATLTVGNINSITGEFSIEITGVADGDSDITVKVDDKETVTKLQVREIVNIIINEPYFTPIYDGDILPITYTPDWIDVEWSSSNLFLGFVDTDNFLNVRGAGLFTISCVDKENPETVGSIELASEDYTLTQITNINLKTAIPDITFIEHGSFKCDITLTPSGADSRVLWFSSNPGVATVSQDGTITPISEGNVKITVRAVNGEAEKVFYLNCKHLEPESITIDNKIGSNGVRIADDYRYELTVIPEGAENSVEFASSDEQIVSVNSNGLLTVKKRGEVTVTAYSAFDSSIFDSDTFECKGKKPTKIRIANPISTYYFGDYENDQIKFNAIVDEGDPDCDSELKWYIVEPNGSISDRATVDNDGLVTFLKEGYCTLVAESVVDPSLREGMVLHITYREPELVRITNKPDQLYVYKKTEAPNTYQLKLYFEPEFCRKDVTWTSSNILIAGIDSNGLLRVNGVGRAIITVKTKSIFPKYDSFIVDCTIDEKIEIKLMNPLSQYIKKNKGLTSGYFAEKGVPYILDLKITPEEYNIPVNIKTSDDYIKEIVPGIINPLDVGVGTIYIETLEYVPTEASFMLHVCVPFTKIYLGSNINGGITGRFIASGIYEPLTAEYDDTVHSPFLITKSNNVISGTPYLTEFGNGSFSLNITKNTAGTTELTVADVYNNLINAKTTISFNNVVEFITWGPHSKRSNDVIINGKNTELHDISCPGILYCSHDYLYPDHRHYYVSTKENIESIVFSNNLKESMIAIYGLDTSSLTSLKGLFEGCTYLRRISIDLRDDLGVDSGGFIRVNKNVTDMSNMFNGCENLYSVGFHTDEFGFVNNTENVTDMSNMFNGCKKLEYISGTGKNSDDVTGIKSPNVSNMSCMFKDCSSMIYFPSLSYKNATDTSYMFYNCSGLRKITANTANVENMNYMFYGTSLETFPDNISFAKAKYLSNTFAYCGNLSYNLGAITLNLPKGLCIDKMFYGCNKLTNEFVVNASSLTDAQMFNNSATKITLNTPYLKTLSNLFSGCRSLIEAEINLALDNTITDASYMFNNCSALKKVPKLNLPSVKKIDYMFKNCSSLTDITNIQYFGSETGQLDSVIDMVGTFYGCTNLTYVPKFSLSLPNVLSTAYLFAYTSLCDGIDLSLWDTINITNMEGMFLNSSIKQLPSLNFKNVTNMYRMYYNCVDMEGMPNPYDYWKKTNPAVSNGKECFYKCSKIPRFCEDSNGGKHRMPAAWVLKEGTFVENAS